MNISDKLAEKNGLRIIDLFEKGHKGNDVNNMDIKPDVLKHLYPYQVYHVSNMINAAKNHKNIIDGSQTGTGKTHTSIALCAQLDLIPFVICPRNIMSSWKTVIKHFGINYISVSNIEILREGKYYATNDAVLPLSCVECPYLKYIKDDDSYEWDFSHHPQRNKIILIFDEAHKFKKPKTINGKILLAAKKQRTLILSGTICDKPNDFGIFGYILGLYKTVGHGKGWILSILRENMNKIDNNNNRNNAFHKYIFPEYGSRMSIEDIGEDFPMNQISVECYDMDEKTTKEINSCYKKRGIHSLSALNKTRQLIENYKAELITEIAINYYEQNKSVVIFVNYVSSFDTIITLLTKAKIKFAQIIGDQDETTRNDNIRLFQTNKVRIIICTIQSGGTSINLHDETGKHPRVSVISPSYSGIELIQTIGRTHRAGLKSPCLQKIIFCAKTPEEKLANIIINKKLILDQLTDDDLNILRVNKP